ncbi:PAS domain-containing protein [Alicyclobacillus sp. TC]|nr:PAS domain-containing protein [Alicyclobacillus sp. TC]
MYILHNGRCLKMVSHSDKEMFSFYKVLLDALPEAITMVNREGEVLAWNQAAAKLYDILPEQIIGQPIGQFFQRGSLMLFQVMESGLPVYGVYHQPRPDKHVYIHTVPVHNREGHLVGAISMEQDITDLVRLSEERYAQQNGNLDEDWQTLLDTQNHALREVIHFLDKIDKLRPDAPLLLLGENGSGKEWLARWIHTAAKRKGPFVVVDCQVLPEGILDMELFGQSAEWYTSQSSEKAGKLETAGQGTLFLRNVDKMAEKTQLKLAQALQSGGLAKTDGQWLPMTCRVVGAAHVMPDADVSETLVSNLRFLFYELRVPSLRERKEDIPAICHFYLAQAAKRFAKGLPQLSPEVMAALTNYHWPGNLPELRRAMEWMLLNAGEGPLTLEHLPRELRPMTVEQLTDLSLPLNDYAQEMERKRIVAALEQTSGNKAQAARLLGISRGALYYKMRQYHLTEY